MTPWTATLQASLSFTISWSLLELMFIELVMPPSHLIHCHSIVNNHRQSIYLNCISFWYNFSLFKLIIVLFAWFKKTIIYLAALGLYLAHRIFVATFKLLVVACEINSLPVIEPQVPCIDSSESYKLDHQGRPYLVLYTIPNVPLPRWC